MPLIDYVNPEEADPEIRELLDEGDRPSSLVYALANNPDVTKAYAPFFEELMYGGNVDRELKELAHVVVSQTNECEYCASSHGQKLVEVMGISIDRLDEFAAEDFGALDERERAVAEFAKQATEDPKRLSADHVDALHDVGFSDADVVELLALVAAANFANIIATGLNLHATDHAADLDRYYPDAGQ